jgi:hypothetical protein
MSSVSRAMRWRLLAGIAFMVRMLCRRSASLIRMMRTSRAIASSILRKDSAWLSSRVLNCSLSSLVSPSTRSAVGAPKRSISCGLVMPQSSIASCISAAITACASSRQSATSPATAMGWVM